MTLSHRRLRTPARDRAVLAEPSFDALPDLVEQNRRRLDTDRVQIDGVPLHDIRQLARREILGSVDSKPLIVTGHQPEPFHPGVWVKNFAAAGLAQCLGGRSLNLTVDNDTVKSADLKFPSWDRWEATRVRPAAVHVAPVRGEQIWETLSPSDEAAFRAVPERVAEGTRVWPYEPILPQAWSRMSGTTLAERFTAARRSFEQSWGCDNLELAVSRLCRTQAFQHFARHLRHDHGRFRKAYNAAVRGYRVLHSLRSRTHPVPDLADDEVPFWRVVGQHRERATAATPSEQLRPRALTLTLFARLCVGDFFLHGIGGGKYDEVTDQIIRDYFDLEPPVFQVVSATLLLPLPHFAATADDVTRQTRLVRDIHWNPHRHLAECEPVAHLHLRERRPPDHSGRRQQYRDFRILAEGLRPLVQDQLSTAEAKLKSLREEQSANRVLQRRDYSWLLYPEATLRPFLQGVQRRAASGAIL
ncbi:hypothetical protein [Limnoglobus roseus]|uniref:Uncharacterized protein n=1 Tax=Limnoglobus roseus TaxID=2598579 RepID=A0A5C1AP91_9BACT|nr:hypothetical protein [Limnoglobus roseus]QEL19034.1 hypothetical protein PX52LOC_06088 [Limnoglobus roseus]